MRKIRAIAMREYRVNVKSKGFLIAVFLMPVLMSGSVIVQAVMARQGDQSVKNVAVIDHTGKLFRPLQEAADARNKSAIFDPATKRQVEATFVLHEIKPQADRDAQLLDMADRVRQQEFFAIVEINADAMAQQPTETPIRYFTNKSTYRELPTWLEVAIGERIRSLRFADAGLDPEVVRQALAPVELGRFGLPARTATGEIKPAEAANPAASFLVPFFVMMMMWMLLMIGVQPLLSGVLEEKMQRISEVLLGSVRPFELMMGKLIGSTLVSMTLLAIYAVGSYIVASRYGKTELVDPVILTWFFAFLLLAMFMYGSLFLAAGASCNELKEAQSLVMPIMFPMIIPMFFLVPIIKDPSGKLATMLSLIPFTSPMLMVMRKSMEAPVPWWQAPTAAIGCLLLTVACVWAAGRIFRVGLLMQGKAPKFTQMIQWAING